MPQTITPNLAQPFDNVKSPFNTQLPMLPKLMIHHKVFDPRSIIVYSGKGIRLSPCYGVSRSERVLSPQVLLKRFDQVRECLEGVLGLTSRRREVVIILLRMWAYYGQVYPKESTVTADKWCSKATYWRTISYLKGLGLVQVLKRYIVRPHAQISNLYDLRRLIVLIARYLAEHGQHFAEKWLEPYLVMPGSQFWPLAFASPGKLSCPSGDSLGARG